MSSDNRSGGEPMSKSITRELERKLNPGDARPMALNRRTFLQLSLLAGGGLSISGWLSGCSESTALVGSESGFQPNAYVHIAPDNTSTLTVSMSEMGQGVRTTLAMFIAEELDLDWSTVKIKQAPGVSDTFGNQGTGGSGSVRDNHARLREFGARARAALVAAAAHHFSLPASDLTTSSSRVSTPDGRSVTYGDLAESAARQDVPEKVSLKDPADFKLLGKPMTGIDVGDIVTGRARYGLDVRRDGMRFVAIARCPTFGGKARSYDAEAALSVPGVREVLDVPAVGAPVHVRGGVAVVADHTWAALQGREALQVQWDLGQHQNEDSNGYSASMHEAVARTGAFKVAESGQPDAALERATKVIESTYEVPFLSHATMEPMNCTAEFVDGGCRIWSPTQFPNWAREAIAEATGIEAEQVEVNVTLLGGGFGRRINPDFPVEAALVAQRTAGPVQVVWTREDDLRNDFYRPPAVHAIKGGLSSDGSLDVWRHRFSSAPIRATVAGKTEDAQGTGEANGASDTPYRIPNKVFEYTALNSGVTRGWWRAVHTTHTTFAVESFLDEMAELAGADPLAFRLAMLDEVTPTPPSTSDNFVPDPRRLAGVLRLAAEQAGWHDRPVPTGRGRGIACAIDHQSYAAEVVEASMENGRIRVHKVVCAADCGPVYNPDGALAQIEGGIVQALSAALGEAVTIDRGGVVQGNFDTYHMLRINDAPVEIEAVFARTDAPPTGLGEPSVPPLAPALANALFRATGQRMRKLPFTA